MNEREGHFLHISGGSSFNWEDTASGEFVHLEWREDGSVGLDHKQKKRKKLLFVGQWTNWGWLEKEIGIDTLTTASNMYRIHKYTVDILGLKLTMSFKYKTKILGRKGLGYIIFTTTEMTSTVLCIPAKKLKGKAQKSYYSRLAPFDWNQAQKHKTVLLRSNWQTVLHLRQSALSALCILCVIFLTKCKRYSEKIITEFFLEQFCINVITRQTWAFVFFVC